MGRDLKWTVTALTEHIVLIKIPDPVALGRALIRFQEYYESPFPEIRGKTFTLGLLKHLYSQRMDRSPSNTGAFTYHGGRFVNNDWDGFNFPGTVIKPFISGFFDPLTKEEEQIVDLFKSRTDNFYIIGVHEEDSPVIEHELCHGLYSTVPAYKKAVDKVLLALPDIENLKQLIMSWGYDESVALDEVHAYISSDYKWMISNQADDLREFGIDLKKITHDKLRRIRKRYYKEDT